MKKIIIYVTFYLIGCFVSYLYAKHTLQHVFNGKWTKGDRVFSISISTFSWVTFVAIAITDGVDNMKSDEPAGW
jgi:hypothetical protein